MVNLPITYSDKQVTPFGGMSLMKRFIDQTAIQNGSGLIQRCKKSNLQRFENNILDRLDEEKIVLVPIAGSNKAFFY